MKKFLKYSFIGLVTLLVAFFALVLIENRNMENLSFRQKVIRTLYPLIMWGSNKSKNYKQLTHEPAMQPPVSIYDFTVELADGSKLPLSNFKGKKLILANTASDCGYTPQYTELQELYKANEGNLMIIAFPANDFKEQEKAGNADIVTFCQRNYGVTFPIAAKSAVVKGTNQNPIFQWLSTREKNGWNIQDPKWNFNKYLIDENGALVGWFDSSVKPGELIIKN
jgi:glutathione peroxidase